MPALQGETNFAKKRVSFFQVPGLLKNYYSCSLDVTNPGGSQADWFVAILNCITGAF